MNMPFVRLKVLRGFHLLRTILQILQESAVFGSGFVLFTRVHVPCSDELPAYSPCSLCHFTADLRHLNEPETSAFTKAAATAVF